MGPFPKWKCQKCKEIKNKCGVDFYIRDVEVEASERPYEGRNSTKDLNEI